MKPMPILPVGGMFRANLHEGIETRCYRPNVLWIYGDTPIQIWWA